MVSTWCPMVNRPIRMSIGVKRTVAMRVGSFERARDDDPIRVLTKGLAGAKETIDAVVYKIKVKDIVAALETAASNNVKINLAIDRVQKLKPLSKKQKRKMKSDALRAHERRRRRLKGIKKSLGELNQSKGVNIKIWNGGKLHSKMVIIDHKRVLTGSYNWTSSARKARHRSMQSNGS